MTDKGAHFYRCDFQVHSPRDLRWTGPAEGAVTHCLSDADRKTYAKTLVEACRKKGLNAIAVTDHHDMLFPEYVRQAAAQETDAAGYPLPVDNRLVVFPGMELTLGVPCQALVIFDADFPADQFELVTNALALTVNPPTEAKTAPVQQLTTMLTMQDVKTELDKRAFLRNRYILLPNVTNAGTHSILRDGQAAKYSEMHCVGGYIDGSFSKLGTGTLHKLSGLDKAWGNKRVAVFQTSDNRFADHRDLGIASTWVKWAVPTAEALRQACLAQESRVLQDAPLLPAVLVRSISVSNSAFLGTVDLALNPQYNALIGGRGTGKSSILEYLRWALCDQPPVVEGEDAPNYQDRRSRLIGATLKPFNATVDVRFEINGVPHLVRRRSNDGSLLLKVDGGDLKPCSEDEVRTLLPIQAYSQKQLSSVSVRVDELLRFITSPIRSQLHRIDVRLAEQSAEIRQSFATRRRQNVLAQTIESRDSEERSLKGQAEAIRRSLTGLSEDDRQLLDQGQVYDEADNAVAGWRDKTLTISTEVATVRDLINGFLSTVELEPDAPQAAVLGAANAEYQEFLHDAVSALDVLSIKAASITSAISKLPPASPWKQWSELYTAFKTKYDEAVARSSAHGQQMAELKRVESLLSEHIRETARLRADLASLSGAEAAYQRLRSEWLALLKDRDDLLDTQCVRLTENSGGAIRAQVKRHSKAEAFFEAIKQSLAGSKISSSRFEGLCQSITDSPDPGATLHAVLVDLENLGTFDTEKEGSDKRPVTPALRLAGFTENDLDRIARFLKPEQWLSVSLTPIASIPIFEHRVREGEYIPFSDASAGQQATSLLKVLLNESGPPLIIDQPEEDLDNPVMLDIVKQVWKAKQNRQLIFASHNANLVVNGDAELVVWCEYKVSGEESHGYIAGEGAIDVPVIREAIKNVMEGGEAAFKLRREKYGF